MAVFLRSHIAAVNYESYLPKSDFLETLARVQRNRWKQIEDFQVQVSDVLQASADHGHHLDIRSLVLCFVARFRSGILLVRIRNFKYFQQKFIEIF